MFADCQQSPEPQNILADIQAAIIRLENQDRDPAILVSALLASVEAYQSLAEEVLSDPIDSDLIEPTSYKKAKASAQAPK